MRLIEQKGQEQGAPLINGNFGKGFFRPEHNVQSFSLTKAVMRVSLVLLLNASLTLAKGHPLLPNNITTTKAPDALSSSVRCINEPPTERIEADKDEVVSTEDKVIGGAGGGGGQSYKHNERRRNHGGLGNKKKLIIRAHFRKTTLIFIQILQQALPKSC